MPSSSNSSLPGRARLQRNWLAVTLSVLSALSLGGLAQAVPSGSGQPGYGAPLGDDGASLPLPQAGSKKVQRRNQSSGSGDDGLSGTTRRWAKNPDDSTGSPDANLPDRGLPRDQGQNGVAGGPPGSWGPGQHRHRGFGGHGMFGGPLDLSKLNLTEEQKQTIKQLRGQNAPRARELRQAMMQKRAELRDLMFDPDASDDKIKAKRLELRAMQDQMDEMVLGDFLSMRRVLTMEQRKKLPEVKPAGPRFAQGPGGPPPGDGPAGMPPSRKNFDGSPAAGPQGDASVGGIPRRRTTGGPDSPPVD